MKSTKKLGSLFLAGLFVSSAGFAHRTATNFDHYLEESEIALNGVEQGNLPHKTDHLCSGYVDIADQPEDIPPYEAWEEAYGIEEPEFRERNANAKAAYGPICSQLGGTLKINNKWSDGTVNANAQKSGRSWIVNMYGGMARLKGATGDGYNIVLCHEIGHLVAGFPFHNGGSGKARGMADEGNSDYFAAFNCFYKLFKDKEEENALIYEEADPKAKEICDKIFADDESRNKLCVRTVVAGHNIQHSFTKGTKPVIGKLDPKKVSRTSHGHPQAQCRTNTTTAGAACKKLPFLDTTYPNSEADMNKHSCGKPDFGEDYKNGVRPRCWFAPRSE